MSAGATSTPKKWWTNEPLLQSLQLLPTPRSKTQNHLVSLADALQADLEARAHVADNGVACDHVVAHKMRAVRNLCYLRVNNNNNNDNCARERDAGHQVCFPKAAAVARTEATQQKVQKRLPPAHLHRLRCPVLVRDLAESSHRVGVGVLVFDLRGLYIGRPFEVCLCTENAGS